ncbi:Chorismate--pyruvate lyase [Kluyvera cryocrescens]|uniref:Chorismate--pyruvate lyase n=1 Tax=Kluyvera cryocrescens TaxID=580 RepID=A0A485B5L8_KLUCR|nr:Chorismate--pyruvate lyase [Kluyvera cryocrescens]
MTKRFEQYGKPVSVTLLNEEFIRRDALADEQHLLADEPRYWLREILLCVGGEPWLAGRTVVPESTLCGPSWRCSNWADAVGPLSVYVLPVNPRFY